MTPLTPADCDLRGSKFRPVGAQALLRSLNPESDTIKKMDRRKIPAGFPTGSQAEAEGKAKAEDSPESLGFAAFRVAVRRRGGRRTAIVARTEIAAGKLKAIAALKPCRILIRRKSHAPCPTVAAAPTRPSATRQYR